MKLYTCLFKLRDDTLGYIVLRCETLHDADRDSLRQIHERFPTGHIAHYKVTVSESQAVQEKFVVTYKGFDLAEGKAMQLAHLREWKDKLNEACYNALVSKAYHENLKLPENATGYDVWRGQDLSSFVANWRAAS